MCSYAISSIYRGASAQALVSREGPLHFRSVVCSRASFRLPAIARVFQQNIKPPEAVLGIIVSTAVLPAFMGSSLNYPDKLSNLFFDPS